MGHAAVERQHAGAAIRLDALVQHQLRAFVGLGHPHAAACLVQRGQIFGLVGRQQGGGVQHGALVGVQYADLTVDLLQSGGLSGEFGEGILKFHVGSSFFQTHDSYYENNYLKYLVIVPQKTPAG